MPKAKKKPVEIDYFRIENPEASLHPLQEWIKSFGDKPDDVLFVNKWGDRSQFVEIKINTLEGSSYDVPAGYIIIRGVAGEYYPCEPEIFAKTYDF